MLFAQGSKDNESGNIGKAYNSLFQAFQKNPREPFYKSELAYAAAAASAALASEDATLSGQLKNQALEETKDVLSSNPHNISYYRTATRTYIMLSTVDKDLSQKALAAVDKTIALAPTDPKALYTKALILQQLDMAKESAQVLEKALQLKPNYKEAYLTLGEVYFSLQEKEKAVETINKLLKLIPGDPQGLEAISKYEK